MLTNTEVKSSLRNRMGMVQVKSAVLIMFSLFLGFATAVGVTVMSGESKWSPESKRQNAVEDLKENLSGGLSEDELKQVKQNMNSRPMRANLGG